MGEATGAPVLDVRELSVVYRPDGDAVPVVRGVSFAIAPGEALGLIGESGSGKSTIAFALMRHLKDGRATAARMALAGEELLAVSPRRLAALRGDRMAMVYQDPMSALNPLLRVGEQVAEGIRRHEGAGRAAAAWRAVALLEQVNLPDPAGMAHRFPHQLSGGQQQRVVIAMAIACRPALLIMDEPTTGLDVTTEAVILDLIGDLRRRLGLAVLFISHNLAVVGEVCDRIGVLYAGELVEQGPTGQVLREPRHPYTIGLLQTLPQPDGRRRALTTIPGRLPDLRQLPTGCVFAPRCELAGAPCQTRPTLETVAPGHVSRCHFRATLAAPKPTQVRGDLVTHAEPAGAVPRLSVDGLRKSYGARVGLPFRRRAGTPALSGVSLSIGPGETHALVGESGSGKSTLALCVAGLLRPDAGRLRLDGAALAARVERRGRAAQRAVQLVFQNPESALNPRRTAGEAVGRPLRLYHGLSGAALRRRTIALLNAVTLDERLMDRYPRDLSGGEKQRVAIARAFAAEPALVICDEPTSALDVSVQASVLNELAALQARTGTSFLFITHDLGVVGAIADTVTVLFAGVVMEQGPAAALFAAPNHPYTEALIAAMPRLDMPGRQSRVRLSSRPASAGGGCVFEARCPRKLGAVCEQTPPTWRQLSPAHGMACHIPPETLRALQGGETGDATAAAPARIGALTA
jgi:peptide/nickel transport system ATP-binding protein